MKSKKLLKIAKGMFKQSLSQELVNTQKVRGILGEITRQKPAHLASILKIYKKLIRQALAREEIIIESASQLTNQSELEKQFLAKTGARKVLFKTNPKIVTGAKITHGDWIWDATLDAKLKQLTIDI